VRGHLWAGDYGPVGSNGINGAILRLRRKIIDSGTILDCYPIRLLSQREKKKN